MQKWYGLSFLTPMRGAYLALAVLTCAVYAPYLSSPLVFDDAGALNPQVLMEYIYRLDISNVMRWLPNATLAHTHLLTDGSIAAMRLGNLALHALTAIAVCKLIHALHDIVAPAPAHASGSGGALAVALLAAAIFAVHPLNVYAVGYLTQRSIIMSTLFMLLMLLALTRWLVSGRHALAAGSVLCYLLSVFCKEHSVMAPAAAVLLAVALRKHLRVSWQGLMAYWLALAAITALIVTLRSAGGLIGAAHFEVTAAEMAGASADPRMQALMAQGSGYRISVLTQLTLFPKYLALWLIPNPQWMSVDMRVPFALDFWTWPHWAGACVFVLYGVLTLVMLGRGGRMGLAGWLMAVPWVLFATELSSARIQEPFVLYRSYLWFATLGALPGMLFSARLPIKVWRAPAMAVVCLMVPLSWNRLDTLANPVALWNDAAKLLIRGDEIGAGRIYYNRGLALRAARRTEEALDDFNRAIALHPTLAPVRNGRARVLYELKRYEEALQDINTAIALDASRSSAYMDRGAILRALGRLEEAAQDLRKACEMGQALACFAAKRMEPAANAR